MSFNDIISNLRAELNKIEVVISGEAHRALHAEVDRLHALHQEVMAEAAKLRPKLAEVLATAEPVIKDAAVTVADEFITYLSSTLGIPIPPLPATEPAPAAPAEAPPAQPEGGSAPPVTG